jgi:hypothetical protein
MRLERDHRVAQRQVHDPVDHQRHRPAERGCAAFRAQAEGPRPIEILDVAGVDLVERREARAAEIARVARPVGRIDLHRISLRLRRRREGGGAQQQGDQCAHRESLSRRLCAISNRDGA